MDGNGESKMNRYIFMMLLVVLPLRVLAQRLDGCPTPEMPATAINMPSHDALEGVLKQLGVGLTAADLAAGLDNPRPDTRSLSALRLAETANGPNLALLMKTWLAEQDDCSKWIMYHAVTMVVRSLSYDPALHPSGQLWVKPFQPCKPLADPLVTLRLEDVSGPSFNGPTIRVVGRNQTPETIPFVGGWSPQELLSATVLSPSGEHAEIPVRLEAMYRPLRSTDGVLTTHGRVFVPLSPHEEHSLWNWKVGDDFDMSSPGAYRISLGGRMAYLGTTVCSNTLEVNVGN
jgi:hypothetical protein